jgi:hypothetical protein
MSETWTIVIQALGGYTLICGGLFWWLGKSFLNRQKGEIEKDVNASNVKVLTEHQEKIEELKSKIQVEESLRQTLYGSYSGNQSKVFEKRLESIEALWVTIFRVRDSVPAFMQYVDIILESEFEEWIKRTDIQEVFGELSIEKITNMSQSSSKDIEKVRPFVGEYLWSLFFAYRAFQFRVVIFTFMEKSKSKPKYWKSDSGVNQILSSVLNDTQVEKFNKMDVGAIQYARATIENIFLLQVQNILTGKSSIEEGIENAKSILSRTQAAVNDTNKSLKNDVASGAS